MIVEDFVRAGIELPQDYQTAGPPSFLAETVWITDLAPELDPVLTQ
jgi:hypothetical protein